LLKYERKEKSMFGLIALDNFLFKFSCFLLVTAIIVPRDRNRGNKASEKS